MISALFIIFRRRDIDDSSVLVAMRLPGLSITRSLELLMNLKHLFITALTALTALSFTTGVTAADYTHSTPAVQGYDVVTYQTDKRPLRGNGNYTATHDGATYLFSSKQNMETFKANPTKYAPAYNGYCAFGVSVGKKFIADPEVWRVVDGKTYLNLDSGIQKEWLKDVPGRIKTADKKWNSIRSSAF